MVLDGNFSTKAWTRFQGLPEDAFERHKKLWLRIKAEEQERWSRWNYFPITRLWTTLGSSARRRKGIFLLRFMEWKEPRRKKLSKCVYEPSTRIYRRNSRGTSAESKNLSKGEERFKFRGFLSSPASFNSRFVGVFRSCIMTAMQIPLVSVALAREENFFPFFLRATELFLLFGKLLGGWTRLVVSRESFKRCLMPRIEPASL